MSWKGDGDSTRVRVLGRTTECKHDGQATLRRVEVATMEYPIELNDGQVTVYGDKGKELSGYAGDDEFFCGDCGEQLNVEYDEIVWE